MSRTKKRLTGSVIIDLEGNQYPFGVYDLSESQLSQSRRVFVRKVLQYRSPKEKHIIDSKLSILKNICHRNVINIKSIEEIESSGFTIYYNYVPLALESAFEQIDHNTFKDLHRQVIQLAIHLAKNYILTSFSPGRCGVNFVDGKPFLKYYLPFNEITISQDISALERSVQLFKVQAMHLLDKIRHPDIFTDLGSSHSEQAFLSAIPKEAREKKLSMLIENRERKFSSLTMKKRKYTSFNDLKERKKSQDSTHDTEMRISNLKKTLKSIRFQSDRKKHYARSLERIKIRVNLLKIRSFKALQLFDESKKEIADNIALTRLLTLWKGF